MKTKNLLLDFLSVILGVTVSYAENPAKKIELPNILWLTSEDNSPFLGCYGDTYATTPNLDKLASEGFLYTHAYANAPVCAPARNTIITGVYACSGGNQHMRSTYLKSDQVKFYPQLLRQAGYYCTNNQKEDYNIDLNQTKNIWDESSATAQYKNRKPGQPFFAVFNTTLSHEHVIHNWILNEKLRHDPKKAPLPPYHPRTPEMEHDWAQYYDMVEDMDTWIGEKLKELDDLGLADNTIVFYYADHGGILARSKRFIYESGTHVPFIVRIPEKYKYLFPNKKPGTKVDRLIGFVDLVPTLLSIADVPIPDYLQGKAFLGKQKTQNPQYQYMFRDRMDERYDLVRAVRDQKYRYIHNYMPHRIAGQHIEYLWRAPSVGSWENEFLNGRCNAAQCAFWLPKPAEELYDTENDPWEVHNLAKDPNYKDVLERMRKANREWILRIKDTGFIPEAERSSRAGNTSFYDLMRNGSVNLGKILNAAETASYGDPANLPILLKYLKDEDSAIRYWGATGLLILEDKAAPAIISLNELTNDPSSNVAIVAAEAIYRLGETTLGEKVLLDNLKNDDFVCTFALNSVDALNITSEKVKEAVLRISKESKQQYNRSASSWILKKWRIVNE